MEQTNGTKEKKTKGTIIWLAALITIAIAWVIGAVRQGIDIVPYLKETLPAGASFEPMGKGLYKAVSVDGTVKGYAAIGRGGGYGGPMTAAVGVDLKGNITGISIISHKETSPFLKKVLDKKIPASLAGKSYNHRFVPGEDVDGVSGATRSANALTTAARRGARRVAADALKLDVTPEKSRPIQLGIPEILLILLFAAGFLAYNKKIPAKTKKTIRWGTLLAGLVAMGFVFTIPLSLVQVNSLLMGYWPDWHAHIFWYLLMAGVLLPMLLVEKSPYCDTFCPFGAAQECLKVIGGGKKKVPKSTHRYLKWLQRFLAWAAVVVALIFRNPAYYNYEVFGTFFNLTGTYVQFALMAVVIFAALFLTRPWCNYLCPLRAVADTLKQIRRMVKGKKEKAV